MYRVGQWAATARQRARSGRAVYYDPSKPDLLQKKMSEATIRLHVEAPEEGGYLATSPDVPRLIAEGPSVTEAVEIAQCVARKMAEACIEHGDPLSPALA
jgi:predicted RNase H-like HicB family nuclease